MDARQSAILTRCHHVARTPPAFFSLELRRPLRSISTASVLSPRSASPIVTELPTTPAPITITSNRSPAITRRFYQSRFVEGRVIVCETRRGFHTSLGKGDPAPSVQDAGLRPC